MFVEAHILQNFAPSNLNRDDTGAPKDCIFGGYRRARISSQCLKRAMREAFRHDGRVTAEKMAVRTKKLKQELIEGLTDRRRDGALALEVATNAIEGIGLEFEKQGKADTTEYLIFLGRDQIGTLVDLCDQNWDELVGLNVDKDGKRKKKAVSKDLERALQTAFERSSQSVDLALFGRMIADRPTANVDGSAQVAHAISTHSIAAEFDYYTAVDDLAPREETGAGMIGTIGFNSACYYRYANIDVHQLWDNLGRDDALALEALRASLRAMIAAVPTGKQNSMAAQNPPSLVLMVTREEGLWSLANAFAKPVHASQAEGDLVAASAAALDRHWSILSDMYGEDGIQGVFLAGMPDRPFSALMPAAEAGADEDGNRPSRARSNVSSLIQNVVDSVSPAVASWRG